MRPTPGECRRLLTAIVFMLPATAALAGTDPGTAAAGGKAQVAAASAGELAGEVLLDVTVNAVPRGTVPVRVIDGVPYASGRMLADWGVGVPNEAPGPNGYSLRALGAKFSIDPTRLSLDVEFAAERFGVREVDANGPGRLKVATPPPPAWGGFFNYDLAYDFGTTGPGTWSGLVEGVLGTPSGVLESSWRSVAQAQSSHPQRFATAFTRDLYDHVSTAVLGDTQTAGGGVGPGYMLSGLRLSRNFAMAPGFSPLPPVLLSGSAALPSTVDIYMNGQLTSQRAIEPGQFNVVMQPVVTQTGDVRMVVRDSLGRQTVYQTSIFSDSLLLAKGLTDYSVAAGRLRRYDSNQAIHYGPVVGTGYYRLGLADRLTVAAYGEAGDGKAVARGGLVKGVVGVGTMQAYAALSHGPGGGGAQATVVFDRVRPKYSAGARYERASGAFSYIDTFGGFGTPVERVFAYGGVNVSANTVMSASGGYDNYADGHQVRRAGVNLNWFGDAGWSFGLFASRSFDQTTTNSVGALLTVNFEGRRFVQANVQRDNVQLIAGRNLRTELDSSWRVGAQGGRDASSRMLVGDLVANQSYGRYAASATAVGDGNFAARVATQGSLIATSPLSWVPSRYMQNAGYAIVDAGAPNVEVTRENQYAGRTGADGVAVVAPLPAYGLTSLGVNPLDLPPDGEMVDATRRIYAGYRVGVKVGFAERRAHRSLTVADADGNPLPVGLAVHAPGYDSVVGFDGLVVVPEGATSLRVSGAGWDCSVAVPATGSAARCVGTRP